MSRQGSSDPMRRSAPPPPAPGATGNSLKRTVKKSPSHTSAAKRESAPNPGRASQQTGQQIDQQVGQDQLQGRYMSLERNYGNLKDLTKKGKGTSEAAMHISRCIDN